MIKIFFFFSFFISPNKVSIKYGEYRNYSKYDHYQLELKSDSTFVQKNSSCTWGYLAKGKWKLRNDTIILNANKIYNRNIGIRTYRKRDIIDTSSAMYKRYFLSYNNVLVQNDSLFLLFRSKEMGINHKIKLYYKGK